MKGVERWGGVPSAWLQWRQVNIVKKYVEYERESRQKSTRNQANEGENGVTGGWAASALAEIAAGRALVTSIVPEAQQRSP